MTWQQLSASCTPPNNKNFSSRNITFRLSGQENVFFAPWLRRTTSNIYWHCSYSSCHSLTHSSKECALHNSCSPKSTCLHMSLCSEPPFVSPRLVILGLTPLIQPHIDPSLGLPFFPAQSASHFGTLRCILFPGTSLLVQKIISFFPLICV